MADTKETNASSVITATMVQLEPPFDQSAELASGLRVCVHEIPQRGRAIVALTKPVS
jgi:hypothetical protein